MSEPNHFNPFKIPYQPIQIVLIGSGIFIALPFLFVYTSVDGGRNFRDALLAIKDIPRSILDSIKGE